MMLRICLTALALTAYMPFVLAPVSAHMGATGVVKERMDLMSALGKAMKTVRAETRGDGPADAATLLESAAVMRDHSARMPALFPEGSHASPSQALPVIDERRSEFDSLAGRLGAQADLLVALADAEAPDKAAVAEWFRETGRICSTCHKTFRAKR